MKNALRLKTAEKCENPKVGTAPFRTPTRGSTHRWTDKNAHNKTLLQKNFTFISKSYDILECPLSPTLAFGLVIDQGAPDLAGLARLAGPQGRPSRQARGPAQTN